MHCVTDKPKKRPHFKLVTLSEARLSEFPLHHGYILEVRYISGSPLRKYWISCDEWFLSHVVPVISQLPLVQEVSIFPVNEFEK